MKLFLPAFALSLISLPILAQIGTPRVGTVRYPDGTLHTVQGVPSNMIVADLPMDRAEAASFSDAGGLLAQHGQLRLLAPDFSTIAEYPDAEKPVVSMGGELTSALAWLPGAHALLHWNGSSFDAFDLTGFDIEGKVTDLQASGPKLARMIVQHADDSVSAITISLRSGNLVSSEVLPGVTGYAFTQGAFVVYTAGKDLIADNLRGYRRNVAMPASDIVMERMSNSWLHLYSPSLQQNWALHLTQAAIDLSLLPGLPEQTDTTAVASNSAQGIK